MPNPAKKNPRVFLDSNIFIAAVLSSRGGSFRIIQEARRGLVIVYTSSFIMSEVARIMRLKYPAYLNYGYELIASTPLFSISNPRADEIERVASFINDACDAPVLAGALKSKAQFLITLDRKHFLTETLLDSGLPMALLNK